MRGRADDEGRSARCATRLTRLFGAGERRIVLAGAGGAAVAVQRPGPACAMTVRRELDSYCLEQTRKRGALFQRVGNLLSLEQTEPGVCLQFAEGLRLRARYAIGADGVQSRVRALLGGADWFRMGFAVEANVECRPGDAPVPLTFDFAPVERGYGWLFPRDGHVNVGLYTEALPGRVRGDGEPDAGRLNRAALERYAAASMPGGCEGDGKEAGAWAGRMGPVVGQYLGLGAAGYRPSAETRVLLAGDAAGFVDPLTGEGIYGAIRSGQAAAEALVKALAAPAGTAPAGNFEKAARALQADLRVAEYAAARFFADPARGFALMRRPVVARLVLECYSRGLPLGWLLRVVRLVGRLSRGL